MGFKTSYKVGYKIGNFLSKMFLKLLKLIWAGTVTAISRKTVLAIPYGCLVLFSVLALHDGKYFAYMIFLFFLFSISFGIWVYFEDYPTKDKRQSFNEVFEEIKLYTNDKTVPYFLYEDTLSEFAKTLAFRTLVPLSEWQAKKEQMEMYFNVKIVDIIQEIKDKRNIHLIVQNEELPEYVEWEHAYTDERKHIFSLGVSYFGIAVLNLDKYPHTFIAGETGSGKSNLLKCLIYQAYYKCYDVILIDFKRGVSFTCFDDMEVYYDYPAVIKILKKMVEETNIRLDLFRKNKVDNINAYNELGGDNLERKIIFIDELAELLKTRDKEISHILYDCIETLVRLSRAVGIHLVMGIQRPDSTIVNGQIKNNVSFRICGRFVDKEPSRIMLSSDIASTLPNIKGRFIIKDDRLQEIQTFCYTYETSSSNETLENTPMKNSDLPCSDEEKELSSKFNFDFSNIKKN